MRVTSRCTLTPRRRSSSRTGSSWLTLVPDRAELAQPGEPGQRGEVRHRRAAEPEHAQPGEPGQRGEVRHRRILEVERAQPGEPGQRGEVLHRRIVEEELAQPGEPGQRGEVRHRRLVERQLVRRSLKRRKRFRARQPGAAPVERLHSVVEPGEIAGPEMPSRLVRVGGTDSDRAPPWRSPQRASAMSPAPVRRPPPQPRGRDRCRSGARPPLRRSGRGSAPQRRQPCLFVSAFGLRSTGRARRGPRAGRPRWPRAAAAPPSRRP